MRIAVAIAAVAAVFAAPAAAAPARIVYSSDGQLWTMNADGSAAQQLTHLGRRPEAYEPDWSPDGTRIAFTSDGGRIWTVRSDGTGAERLTPREQKATYETSPAWSPDGSTLAFARTRFSEESLRTSIIVVDPDGGNERTVVSDKLKRLGGFSEVTWSPDGQRLVFTRHLLGDHGYFHPALVSVALDGSGRTRLARNAGGASYSPDGARIAFVSVRDHNGSDCGSDECSYRAELYVMNADGSAQTRLTRNKGDEQGAAWSPDGGRIAFQSTRNYPRGDNPEVYSIASDGSCLTWLTNGTADSGMPEWDPDASLSSDPGECGAVDREPVTTVDPTSATKHARRFTPLWLGPVAGENVLLSQVQGASLYYDDCASFAPSECGPSLQLLQQPICTEPWQRFGSRYVRGLRRIHGALVFDGRGGVDVYTGTGSLHLFGVRSPGVRAAVAALRPVTSDAPPASLPPPSFGKKVWRRAGPRGRDRLRALGARHGDC